MADLKGFTERYGLNSRLVKQNGKLVEEVYKVGGRYDPQIRAVIGHLEAAQAFATPSMKEALAKLVQWYRTGEDADRKAYDIAWVADKDSPVDTINGFIEVYMDPRGVKGSWEALVFYVNRHKTVDLEKLATNAQWFEDRMPFAAQFRKTRVTGITAKAIDVVIETGESGPVTPIGINLPNDQKIREQYGSKSVSLANVTEAYDRSTVPEFRKEFAWAPEEVTRANKWSAFSGELHTNMHEVIGHASGKMADSVSATAGGHAQGAVFGTGRGPGRSHRPVLPGRPEAGRARHPQGRGSGRDRPDRVRGLHQERAGAAAAGARRAGRSKKTTCATVR